MRRRNGFSLIELLVVIAVIAILAAIIFPVYAQAKKSAYRSSDMTNMNTLRTALQLYKTDNGDYPPALLGYVGPYDRNGNTLANVVPPNQVKDALFPKRVESLSVFRPALLRVSDNPPGEAFNAGAFESGASQLVTAANWPNGILAANTGNRANQRFGPNDGFVKRAVRLAGGCQVATNYYYRISGYDVAPATNLANARMETHYQLFWSGYTVPANPCNPTDQEQGSAADDTRQLGYAEPPETTVVTWNSFFRDYQNGAPMRIKQDLVLFLGGNARPMDSVNVATQAWAIRP